jgi:transposase
MHVDIIPNRNSRPCALIRETYKENGRVRHRTLLNISDLEPERIMAIKRAFRGDFDEAAFSGLAPSSGQGPQFGALYALYEIAKQLGLCEALGRDRKGKLALLMVIAQVICSMSKRAVVEWAKDQAIYEVLGLGSADEIDFDEDDLYAVLDDLSERRFRIELDLFKSRSKGCSQLFLYDVTSSYLEGRFNELAQWGYNRDGKKGKKQIVIGLLTDEGGDPVAVDVFQGNTSDPRTVTDQIRRLSDRFKVKDVVFVGDRGMLKRLPLQTVAAADFRYITAITKPQVEKLIKDGVLQLGLFDESLGEIEHEGIRYVFRRNPVRVDELRKSRQDRVKKAQELAHKLSEQLLASHRKRVDVALKAMNRKLEALKIDGLVKVEASDRTIQVEIDERAWERKSRLDGVYVLKTDVASDRLDREAIHKAYKSLAQVESDFRSMKSDLDVRPVFVRKEKRTRGHVLVVTLALMLRRELQKRLADSQTEVSHAIATLGGWTLLTEGLAAIRFRRLPQPSQRQKKILDRLGLRQPTKLSVYSTNSRQKPK